MQKIKFDARIGRNEMTKDLFDNPSKYSFTHNFKVHFKRGILQALANKLDVSISQSSAEIPSTNLVMQEFNERMKASIVVSNTRRRYSQASYHVTQIEYKESFAFYDPQMTHPPSQAGPTYGPTQTLNPQQVGQESVFCRNCGASLPLDSKFCNKCGTPVN